MRFRAAEDAAIEALLGGATPWPANAETFELLSLLKPLGDIESCRFADWRNQAVTLSDARCASAVYSRVSSCCGKLEFESAWRWTDGNRPVTRRISASRRAGAVVRSER